MIDDMIETIQSLNALMREETGLLATAGRSRDIEPVAAAKLKLTATLETQMAALAREQPDWRETMAPEPRAVLIEALDELQDVAADNARMLSRQIDLSRDIMDAIAEEAKRLSGTRRQTYGAAGGLFEMDQATPISVNTSL
ncbi:flagellar biosynthesis protein FlgN [Sphingomonas changnyeongensis]|uniref:Flagellar biosynthesis protein FlgN n=1 Tax=Sphingomonas changnyeongensis TaxID=2698679 RepID=A0A7Z2NUN0_9SPHN|nr:flagellar biosynthesis protein FlgN [Sphingomonas changnyeongensis]QHL89756.1 flagellar biosynthesis protein FlgN [Sphingomonas changnyeongensis]